MLVLQKLGQCDCKKPNIIAEVQWKCKFKLRGLEVFFLKWYCGWPIITYEGEIQSAKSSGTRSLAERMEKAQIGCKRSEC